MSAWDTSSPWQREPTGRSRVRPQAPDPAQEQLRAAAGFPWCDTCQAPAAWSETAGDQHVRLTQAGRQTVSVPDRAPTDHPVTLGQWSAADPW